MQPYANQSGDSGVGAYQTTIDSITVQFHDGSAYTYDIAKAGRDNVERMKVLARNGKGLGTFINVHVKNLYSRRTG